MTQDDYPAFLCAAEALAKILPGENKPSTGAAWLLYFGALTDHPIEAVLEAMRLASGRLRWFPVPADLLELIAGSDDDRGALAWARIYAHRGWGRYRAISFGDPVIHAAVVAIGGWSRIEALAFADAEAVDVAVTRKEFLQFHRVYSLRGAPAVTPAVLCTAPDLLALPGVVDLGDRPALAAESRAALPEPAVAEMPEEFRAMVDALVTEHRPVGRVVIDRSHRTSVTAAEQADHERRKAETLARFGESLRANG